MFTDKALKGKYFSFFSPRPDSYRDGRKLEKSFVFIIKPLSSTISIIIKQLHNLTLFICVIKPVNVNSQRNFPTSYLQRFLP